MCCAHVISLSTVYLLGETFYVVSLLLAGKEWHVLRGGVKCACCNYNQLSQAGTAIRIKNWRSEACLHFFSDDQIVPLSETIIDEAKILSSIVKVL